MAEINFLLILLIAGLLNLLMAEGWPAIQRTRAALPVCDGTLLGLLPFANSRWFQMAWLFFKNRTVQFWRRVCLNRVPGTRRGSGASLAVE